ncbi:MAG TPA: cation-translocating P-type ATPase [Actinomycetes bacterium]|nr:cation-translocating P-type ATPase [Actinomycetes bacterium]
MSSCCEHDHDEHDAPGEEHDEHGSHGGGAERLIDVGSIRASVLAGLLLGTGLLAGRLDARTVATVLLAGALMVGGWTFVPATLGGLLRGRLGVGTLMTIAAVGAVLLGELGEAATLAFLFSIAEGLEAYSLAKTRRGLRALLALVPARATVLRGGREVEVAPAELRVGQRMLLRPGERAATDGVVRGGRSTLDVSAITGESIPVEAGPGEMVYAGAINGGGALEVEITAASEDNSLARMVHIVEQAQERKGRSQRLADRFARPLVPGVLIAASLIALVGSLTGDPRLWLSRALVVLVAAAPCAFAISVPVTVVAAIGAATRGGVLVKGGAALEALGRVSMVALDKTGTLTRNQPQVVDVVSADGAGKDDVLGVAAGLEARSEHPLGRAILAAANQVAPGQDVTAVPGHGLAGRVGGRPARLGKPGFVVPDGLVGHVERLQAEGATVVLVEQDHTTLGAIAVRDELRPEAAAAVERLRRMGMEVAMLTGDNRRTAQALGQAAGIDPDHVHAELLPEDKARIVTELAARQRPRGAVAMVGDGINDAPALATADLGIAMGAMGVDVAIETADVALMGEDLRHLPDAFAHGRRALRIMRQNLLLSGSILVVLIPLAASGMLGLAAVVAAHELAEVLVIANGVRASRRPASTILAPEPDALRR